MKNIGKVIKEEDTIIREVTDDELKNIESGGLCFFWTRCLPFRSGPIRCYPLGGNKA